MTTKIQEKQEKIEAVIKKEKEAVIVRLNKIIDLRQKKLLCLSKKFTIEDKNFGTKKEPIIRSVKFMHYEDYFTDEDTGQTIAIQRARPIEVDGQMCDEWVRPIQYYTLDDI
jgi:hypothetical protein